MPGSTAELVAPGTSLRDRVVGLRWIWLPLAVYAASRVIDGLVLAWGSRFQIATSLVGGSDPTTGFYIFEAQPESPGYLGVATNWDGQWYQLIATQGYQSAAIDPGPISTRAWAFPPLYPKTVGWLMQATGWEFGLAAAVVSILCGAVAMVLIFRLARPHVGELGAAGAVALTCMFVSSPLLQVAYSESMGLALLAWALLLLRRGSYWWAIVPTVLLAFTRIVTPPLAIVAVAVWLHSRRGSDPRTSAATLPGMVVFATVAVTSAFYWSALSVVLRGTSDGDRALDLTTGYSAGYFGAFFSVSPLAALLPIAIAALVVRITWSERHNWGVELSSWAAAYLVFVLAVTPPTTGLLRYLLLAFPFALAVVGTNASSPRRRVATVAAACVVLLVLQVAWVRFSFLVAPVSGLPTLMP